MARVTAEDCLAQIPNPFVLTRVAAKRARQLARGAVSTLPVTDHKSTVTALREIASGSIGIAVLDEAELPRVEIPRLELDPFEPDLR